MRTRTDFRADFVKRLTEKSRYNKYQKQNRKKFPQDNCISPEEDVHITDEDENSNDEIVEHFKNVSKIIIDTV